MEIPVGTAFIAMGAIFGFFALATQREKTRQVVNHAEYVFIKSFSMGRQEQTFNVIIMACIGLLLIGFGLAVIAGLIDLPPQNS